MLWFLPYIDMNQPWVYMCPPVLNPPPTSLPIPNSSGLFQCTGFECPASCIQLGLVIYFTYGNTHRISNFNGSTDMCSDAQRRAERNHCPFQSTVCISYNPLLKYRPYYPQQRIRPLLPLWIFTLSMYTDRRGVMLM